MAQELQGPRSQRSQGPSKTPARTGAGTWPLPRHPSPREVWSPKSTQAKWLQQKDSDVWGRGCTHGPPLQPQESPKFTLPLPGRCPRAPEKCTLSARQAPSVGRAAENLQRPGSPGAPHPSPRGPCSQRDDTGFPTWRPRIPGRKSQIPEPRKAHQLLLSTSWTPMASETPRRCF